MTAASPLALPGGPTFAGWSRQFASLQPRALAACHLPLHSIEVLLRIRRQQQADALTRLLLQQVPDQGGIAIARLASSASFASTKLRELLRELERSGLISIDSTQRVVCTDLGRSMRDLGTGPSFAQERRSFCFLDLRPASPPRFVTPDNWPLRPWPSGAPRPSLLGVAALRDAINSSAEWKRENHFAEEIAAVVEPSELDSEETYRAIAVVRLELLSAALVCTGSESRSEWLVFPAKSEGWSLGQTEVLRLAGDTLAKPPEEMWRTAWRNWCASRRLGSPDVLDSRIETSNNEVRLQLPSESSEAVRKPREEFGKSETWLTIDAGPFRFTAKLVLSRI